MRLLYVPVMFLLALASCAPTSVTPMTSVPPAKIIMVVPSIPPFFRIATQGFTVFGNNLDVIDDSSWNLNQLLADTATKALTPEYQVVVGIPDTDLGDAQSQQQGYFTGAPPLGTLVKQHVKSSQPVDLYLVFTANNYADMNDGQTEIAIMDHSIGIDEHRAPWGQMTPVLHTYLLVSVIDAHTLKTIYQTPLFIPTPPLSNPVGQMIAPKEMKAALPLYNFTWKDSWSEMTDDQRRQIEDGIKALLVQSVTYSLSQMAIVKQQ